MIDRTVVQALLDAARSGDVDQTEQAIAGAEKALQASAAGRTPAEAALELALHAIEQTNADPAATLPVRAAARHAAAYALHGTPVSGPRARELRVRLAESGDTRGIALLDAALGVSA